MVLNAGQIKAAAKLITDSVEVPEWGGTVLVKMLSGKEMVDFYIRQAAERKTNGDQPIANYQARYCVATMCDEAGALLYAPDQAESDDADWDKAAEELGNLPSSGPVIERIYDKARKLNKMFTEEEEQQLKNSAPIHGAAA